MSHFSSSPFPVSSQRGWPIRSHRAPAADPTFGRWRNQLRDRRRVSRRGPRRYGDERRRSGLFPAVRTASPHALDAPSGNELLRDDQRGRPLVVADRDICRPPSGGATARPLHGLGQPNRRKGFLRTSRKERN